MLGTRSVGHDSPPARDRHGGRSQGDPRLARGRNFRTVLSRIRRAGCYAAAFQTIPQSGPANLRVAVVAPVDEFFANILSERGRLFAATLGFVAAMVPIVFFIGSLLSRSLRALAEETDRIQRFEPAVGAAGAFDRSARSTNSATPSPPCAR